MPSRQHLQTGVKAAVEYLAPSAWVVAALTFCGSQSGRYRTIGMTMLLLSLLWAAATMGSP
jgi:hypothetical protein